MPEFTDITIPIYLVSLLFAAPIPTLVTCSCTFTKVDFFYDIVDYGIL